jgi:hypothetical protein
MNSSLGISALTAKIIGGCDSPAVLRRPFLVDLRRKTGKLTPLIVFV